jgi:hypothetical protein
LRVNPRGESYARDLMGGCVRCGICSTSQAHTYYARIPTLKWFILGANVDAAAMINLSYIELPTISSILYPVMLYAGW